MEISKEKQYEILFIGNSYTYYNDLPENLFAPAAKSIGYNINAKRITKGGWYLFNSASPDDEVGALVEAELNQKKYDYVVLQEQSTCPILNPKKFFDGVRKLVEKIRANGATPLLYVTWGRKDGSDTLTNNGLTNESMTYKLAAAYEAIADELGIDVAHVGLAFRNIDSDTKNDIELYFEDLSHPSYSGSYLAALTILAKITGCDPRAVGFCGALAQDDAELLKNAAYKAVFETPCIPTEYKTTTV